MPYKIMISCDIDYFPISRKLKGSPDGFINIKFYDGNKDEAGVVVISTLKNQMLNKGFSVDQIMRSKFSIEEIESIPEMPIDREVEEAFVYY